MFFARKLEKWGAGFELQISEMKNSVHPWYWLVHSAGFICVEAKQPVGLQP